MERNSSRRDGSRSAGRMWLSASSAKAKPTASTWDRASSQTSGMASWNATPFLSAEGMPWRQVAMGHPSDGNWLDLVVIIDSYVKKDLHCIPISYRNTATTGAFLSSSFRRYF